MPNSLPSGEFLAAKQPCRTLTFCAEGKAAEVRMPHSREKSPGSFRDELGGVIERVAPDGKTASARPGRPHEPRVRDTAELNERLFEQAWKKTS